MINLGLQFCNLTLGPTTIDDPFCAHIFLGFERRGGQLQLQHECNVFSPPLQMCFCPAANVFFHPFAMGIFPPRWTHVRTDFMAPRCHVVLPATYPAPWAHRANRDMRLVTAKNNVV